MVSSQISAKYEKGQGDTTTTVVFEEKFNDQNISIETYLVAYSVKG